MIFPRECKEVGYASTRPCGMKVYFLSRYLVVDGPGGCELREVVLDPSEKGMMRNVREERVLAGPGEVLKYPRKVQLHDRARLVRLARETGCRCTVFTGLDEHVTFVLDPDPGAFQKVVVYDVIPPRPTLSACIRDLEEGGLFGDRDVTFEHRLQDLSTLDAGVFPCRAAGFPRTLDADPLVGGEKVAGCLTARQFIREAYGRDPELVDICPLSRVREEPFIARCCRKEREGVGMHHGYFGAVVHWGAGPPEVYRAVCTLLDRWRERPC